MAQSPFSVPKGNIAADHTFTDSDHSAWEVDLSKYNFLYIEANKAGYIYGTDYVKLFSGMDNALRIINFNNGIDQYQVTYRIKYSDNKIDITFWRDTTSVKVLLIT